MTTTTDETAPRHHLGAVHRRADVCREPRGGLARTVGTAGQARVVRRAGPERRHRDDGLPRGRDGGGVRRARRHSYRFLARYSDIVERQRVVYTYDMFYAGQKLSVSIGSFELSGKGDSTDVVYTESIAIHDGREKLESRRDGTEELLDALGRSLDG